jgi:transposase
MSVGSDRRDLEKQNRWMEAMRKFEASGLTVRQFCVEQKLNENLFYSWKKILRERALEAMVKNGGPAFVPIELKSESKDVPKEACIELRTPSGYICKVPAALAQEICQLVFKILVSK